VVTAQQTEATTVLRQRGGATVTVAGTNTVTVEGLPGDRWSRRLLNEAAIPLSPELLPAATRANLEEAYMDLTRGAIEFASEGTVR